MGIVDGVSLVNRGQGHRGRIDVAHGAVSCRMVQGYGNIGLLAFLANILVDELIT